MLKKSVSIFFILFIVGCSSGSQYSYHNKSVLIEKGVTQYFLKDVTVNLSLGHGAIENDTTFASQEELAQEFKEDLEKYLKEKNIFDSKVDENSIGVSVTIDYLRKFNHGGKALNKPEISHRVVVSKGEAELAKSVSSRYTTKYAYFEDVAVNFEISTFSWDEEDEPRDVDLISKLIIDDLSELGE